jgi:adenine C2-methylase RlmN of 23S rRNA A2503 and tRNA A37
MEEKRKRTLAGVGKVAAQTEGRKGQGDEMKLLRDRTLTGQGGRVFKFFFKTEIDNHLVEAVLVDHADKSIFCYPTQIGCPMQCKICKARRFVRNLDPCELNSMVHIGSNMARAGKPVLLSAMGVGEPTLNPHYVDHVRRLRRTGRRIAFSSMLPRVDKFEALLQSLFAYRWVKFQISLHAVTTQKRQLIFGGWPVPLDNIKQALALLKRYGFPKTQIDLNYTLIKDVNDSHFDAVQLALVFPDQHIKISKFNQIEGAGLEPSPSMNSFCAVLHDRGVDFERYTTDGVDIHAACGMTTNGRMTDAHFSAWG